MGAIIRMSLIASLLVGLSVAASADVITDRNDKVVAAGIQARQAPFVHTRSVAIVHVAMFDAVNAIDRRYTPYRVQGSTAAGASREAAAAAAAHFALVASIRTKRRMSIALIKRRWRRLRTGSRNRKASSLANRWRRRFSRCERKTALTYRMPTAQTRRRASMYPPPSLSA